MCECVCGYISGWVCVFLWDDVYILRKATACFENRLLLLLYVGFALCVATTDKKGVMMRGGRRNNTTFIQRGGKGKGEEWISVLKEE